MIDATAEKDLNLTDFLRCDMWEIKKYSDSLTVGDSLSSGITVWVSDASKKNLFIDEDPLNLTNRIIQK